MSARTLRWHYVPHDPGTWRAWATELDPEAIMSPYYVIEQAGNAVHRAARNVFLAKCRSCGGDRQQICSEINLAVAKASAQADYDKRIAQAAIDMAVAVGIVWDK